MAQLAILEGEEKTGISLDDLFDVNDFLGVRLFGVDDWNKIKQFACQIAKKAISNPTVFYIDSLKDDYQNYKPSKLANDVFGFNDAAGCSLMGSIPWERMKVKMDNELLGGILDTIKKGIGYVDIFSNLPGTAAKTGIKYVSEETPVKNIPTYSFFYENVYEPGNKLLSYVRPDRLVDEAKETTGIRDNSEVEAKAAQIQYEQSEAYDKYIADEQARKAAEAAAKASYAATAEQAEQLKYSKQLREYNDAIQAEQDKLNDILYDIEFQQSLSANKYIGYAAAGGALLLGLYWWKNRKKNK